MYAQPLQALVEITKTKKLYDLKQPETTYNNLKQPTMNEKWPETSKWPEMTNNH